MPWVGSPGGPPAGWGKGWGYVAPNPHKPRPGKPKLEPPTVAAGVSGYLTFQGIGFVRTHDERQFSVLCGDQPPTITDGYAKWGTIDRPLLRGVTVPQGYNPATMQVSIRFGNWDSSGWQTDDAAGRAVEGDIEKLQWMAGTNFYEGPSPVVYMSAFGKNGQTGLIPYGFETAPWVIQQGITWGQSYRSNPGGLRVYQDAAFTLVNYLGFNTAPAAVSQEAGGYFTSTRARDTPLKIAQSPSSQSPPSYQERLAQRIVSDPKNRALKLKSVHSKIKPGKRVHVPDHSI